MDMITRTSCRSLAKSIVSVEQELGTKLEVDLALEHLQQEYLYVAEDDQDTLDLLKAQVSLEVAAERNAKENSIPANKLRETAVALTALDRKLGTLSKKMRNKGWV
jgi:hypothetical protein